MQVTQFKIEPIKVSERPRCAHCNKGMTPSPWRNTTTVKTEDELAALQTNRRVIGVRREMMKVYDNQFNETGELKLRSIHVKFWPDSQSDWGKDGVFCTDSCAIAFAHAAVKAGYRIKR